METSDKTSPLGAPSDRPAPPLEPVLDVDEIQGNILPGFNKPHAAILGFVIDDLEATRGFLGRIAGTITTARKALDFVRDLREYRAVHGKKPEDLSAAWVNIAFSYEGLKKLTGDVDGFEDDAFRLGMPTRSPFLGDPTSPASDGAPRNWIIGGPEKIPEVVLVFGADHAGKMERMVDELRADATGSGLSVVYEERGQREKGAKEHFGFQDGISQPGVRGRASDAPHDYVSPRHIAPDVIPDAWIYGKPGQYLVWPGEFVFGYPRQGADALVPGPLNLAAPEWGVNGSYLVFRRLRQDVALFWRFITETAGGLAQTPGFVGMTPTKLAATLVGRWPSGAPVSRTPDADIPALGADPLANNDFKFSSDTDRLPLADTERLPPVASHAAAPAQAVAMFDAGEASAARRRAEAEARSRFPDAKADPVGLICPHASHIRKVNTRDSSNDQGGHEASFNRRILRRAIPFGAPLADPLSGKDPLDGNRGLLFLSYQTSIVDQFEFLQNSWMGNDKPPRSPGGVDLFIGMNGRPGENRARRCVIFGKDAEAADLETRHEWVMPTGGAYLFCPAVSALRNVLAKRA